MEVYLFVIAMFCICTCFFTIGYKIYKIMNSANKLVIDRLLNEKRIMEIKKD